MKSEVIFRPCLVKNSHTRNAQFRKSVFYSKSLMKFAFKCHGGSIILVTKILRHKIRIKLVTVSKNPSMPPIYHVIFMSSKR